MFSPRRNMPQHVMEMDEENYSDDSPVASARKGETTIDPTHEDSKSKSNTKMSAQKMLSAV